MQGFLRVKNGFKEFERGSVGYVGCRWGCAGFRVTESGLVSSDLIALVVISHEHMTGAITSDVAKLSFS